MRFHEIRNGMGGLSPASPTAGSVPAAGEEQYDDEEKEAAAEQPCTLHGAEVRRAHREGENDVRAWKEQYRIWVS